MCIRDSLIINLEAPMLSYGSTAVDNIRPSEDFPGRALITGLLANALGWTRQEHQKTQRLQERISHAARNEATGPGGNQPLHDFHTASLGRYDTAWSTTGIPETRAGSEQTYNSPVLRRTEYRADLRTLAALTLDNPAEHPTLEELAQALQYPARTLFIGRKTCLPSGMIYAAIKEAETATEALSLLPSRSGLDHDPVQWDGDSHHESVTKTGELWVNDLRDWRNGVHTGQRLVNTGLQRPSNPQPGEPA